MTGPTPIGLVVSISEKGGTPMAMAGGTAKLVHTGYPENGKRKDKPIRLYAYYKSTQDQATNRSTLSCGMYVVTPSGYDIGPWTDYNGSYVGTTSNTFMGNIPNFSGTRWLVENKTFVVDHDDEGEAEATIRWKWGVYSSWGQFENKSGSFKVKLPSIARASTIGATDANIGAVSSVIVNRKSTAYTHSIAFKFGSLSGYLNSDGSVASAGTEPKFTTANIAFRIPQSFYAQIPNAKSGKCMLTCTTYSGETQIGSKQICEFTVTAEPSVSTPKVSGSVVDINPATLALTKNEAVFVRYFSNAQCVISSEAQNGATIALKQIQGTAVTGNTLTIPGIEADSVRFYAKDSRGYSNEFTSNLKVVPYVRLTNNASVERTDPTSGNAVLTLRGNFFDGSFGSVYNTVEIFYKVGDGDYIDITAEIDTSQKDSYSASIPLSGLDYKSSHMVTVKVYDQLDEVTKTLTVKKGIPVFDWGEEDFATNVILNMKQGSVTHLDSVWFNTTEETSELGLETWLNGLLRTMPDRSVMPVAWNCYPHLTGATICSFLFRYRYEYAALFGFCYDGNMYLKTKYEGSWKDTAVSTTSLTVEEP